MTDLDWTVQDEERDRDGALRGNASWAAAEIIRQRRVIDDLLQAMEDVRVLSEAVSDHQLAIIARNAIDKAKGWTS